MPENRALLIKVGEELCNVVWEKTKRGEDDRFQPDDLPVIFIAACLSAIRKSSDPDKAGRNILGVLEGMLKSNRENEKVTVQ